MISKSIIDFCESKGIDKRRSRLAGLCSEELTDNILRHGVYDVKHNYVSVRVVCKDALILRFQDNCHKFDPRSRMNLIHTEKTEENIGLRMVANLASSIDYYNNAGINNLIIKI